MFQCLILTANIIFLIGGEVKKTEKEIKRNEFYSAGVTPDKKRTFKGAATAARFAARLSPKSQRRKVERKLALMKVLHYSFNFIYYFG